MAKRSLQKLTITVLAGLALPVLAACSLREIERNGQILEERIAIMESGAVPPQVRRYAEMPFEEVEHRAARDDAWARFEYARRLELGIGRPVDVQCAVYWFHMANNSNYTRSAPPPQSPAQSVTTSGIPQARAAIRRLVTADPNAAAAIDPRLPDNIEIGRRCSAPFRNRAYYLVEPQPLPRN
jgi:hypothetical protein